MADRILERAERIIEAVERVIGTAELIIETAKESKKTVFSLKIGRIEGSRKKFLFSQIN